MWHAYTASKRHFKDNTPLYFETFTSFGLAYVNENKVNIYLFNNALKNDVIPIKRPELKTLSGMIVRASRSYYVFFICIVKDINVNFVKNLYESPSRIGSGKIVQCVWSVAGWKGTEIKGAIF